MNYVMCFVKCVMLDMGVDVVCVMWEEHKSSEIYFSIIELIFKKSVQYALQLTTQCKVQ